jgi:DNA-binding Xre family transcriptional regulator
MKINYSKLFIKLKANNLTQKEFKARANISGGTMQKLINNDSITTNTICRICDYFRCMPDEIMEFIPEENYPENIKAKQQAKQAIEAQIAELQAKLKQIK